MPKIVVTTRSGEQHELEGSSDMSVMEIIRNNGIDELIALCGGSCSCATCHVYVDPEFASRLAPMSEDEDDLLESSDHRIERSRLSCQILAGPELEGLRITIAPGD